MSIVKRTLKRPDPATNKKTAYLVRVEGRRDAVTGKRRQFSRQVATMKEAKALEAEWTSGIARGTDLDPAKTTVAELLASWLATKRGEVTPNSEQDYEIVCRLHIIPALGDIRVQKLTAPRLQAQYSAWAEAGMSARMIRGCHMRLSQALRQAVRFGIVSSNVCDSVSPPKLGRGKADTWSPQEALTFLDTAMNRPVLHRGRDSGIRRPDDLAPLWHLLLLEGMRRGEALGLRWRDVNVERGTAHLVQTVAPDKSNRGRAIIQDRTKTLAGARSVRLTARTLQALKDHRSGQIQRRLAASQWQDNDLIVCTSLGTPVNPNNVSRSFDAIVKAAGLRRIRVHDLRHTSATLLLLAGTPAKIVSERLGHASVGITLDLYSHVLPDMQADAATAMDGVFDRAKALSS